MPPGFYSLFRSWPGSRPSAITSKDCRSSGVFSEIETTGSNANPFFERLRERAHATRRRIVFPEGDDRRVIEAARRLKSEGLAEPLLIASSPVAGVDCVWPA